MTIKINFDTAHNPEEPTFILSRKNGDKIGKINAHEIEVVDSLNDASEISFTVYKYIDGEQDALWDDIVDFKLVYCVEWNKWFEITVELDESTETTKTISGICLGQAELSQIMLYSIQINTEDDIARDDYVVPTVLYNDTNHEASLLHRIMEKAPHYSVIHVDSTIANIQRTFEFDGTSIYDAFQDIAKEINCLFVLNSDSDSEGNIQRTISVYDLESNCLNCGHRGEFTMVCPKCNSTDINEGYGEDTLIFVTSDELAESISLSTDTDAVKNCFKLEAGDDLMTATIRNCNPNGTDYIWYFSDDMKAEMPEELVESIESYDSECEKYQTSKIDIDASAVNKYNELVKKYKSYNDELEYIPTDSDNNPNIIGYSALMNAYYNTIDLEVYLESSMMPNAEMSDTNAELEAAKLIDNNLSPVSVTSIEYISKASADNAVLYVARVIVDSRYRVKIAESTFETQETSRIWNGKFTVVNYSDEEDAATSGFVSVIVDDDYEHFIKQKLDKSLSHSIDDLSISGLFEKPYNIDHVDNVICSSDKNCFQCEIKKYSLNRLKSFYDACQACVDILVSQGIADRETWSDYRVCSDCGNTNCETSVCSKCGYSGEFIVSCPSCNYKGSSVNKCSSCGGTNIDYTNDMYTKLYVPYVQKLDAISNEMKIRENEIAIISGVYNNDKELVTYGLQNYIIDIKNDIQKKLDFQSYIGEELWMQFCAFRREDKYSNDNYISDGFNNAEIFSKALEFIQVAQNEIYKSAELQHSISSDLKNLLAIDKFSPIVDDFKVGNWIRVMIDDKVYKLRLVEYSIDYDSIDEISVEFSDAVKVKNSMSDVQSIISQASSMATSYSTVKRQAQQGNKSDSILSNWTSAGLDTTNIKIIGGSGNQVQTWDDHGMLFREYDDIFYSYDSTQLKIINSTIAITDDNWQSVKTAIGKFNYIDPRTNELKSAYGVNGETIVGKLIIGQGLGIYNESGSMTFDESGFIVTNADNTNKVTIDPNSSSIFNIQNKNENSEYRNVLSFDDEGNLVIVGNIIAQNLQLLSGATIGGDKIDGLSAVALTGRYSDLIEKPELFSIPTNNATATAGQYLSKQANGTEWKSAETTIQSNGSLPVSGKAVYDFAVNSSQGSDNAGKFLYTDDNGDVTLIDVETIKTLLGI